LNLAGSCVRDGSGILFFFSLKKEKIERTARPVGARYQYN